MQCFEEDSLPRSPKYCFKTDFTSTLIDHLTFLAILNFGRLVSDEIFGRIHEAQLTFANLYCSEQETGADRASQ